jgi:alpha-L-fucosidase 2
MNKKLFLFAFTAAIGGLLFGFDIAVVSGTTESIETFCDMTKSDGLCLWYDQPATSWMTEALPIGNGPMGAMLFGGTELERIQFNEISFWGGDRMLREDKEAEDMGYYQAFGDIFIRLGHDMAKVKNYRRQLDIERAICSVAYEYEGVRYQRTAFASHPEHVIVVHLTAQPG